LRWSAPISDVRSAIQSPLSGRSSRLQQTDAKPRFCYDSAGRRTAQIDPLGVAASVDCSTAAPSAHTTNFTYNAYGDQLTSADPLGHGTVNTYDANRNLDTSKDGDLNTTTYKHDPANQLTEVDRPDSTTLKNHYWGDGTINKQIDGANNATVYAYGGCG